MCRWGRLPPARPTMPSFAVRRLPELHMEALAVKPHGNARAPRRGGAAGRCRVVDRGARLSRTVTPDDRRRSEHARRPGEDYRFSSEEMLFEAAIERRASRLVDAWRAALNGVRVARTRKVEDILGRGGSRLATLTPNATCPGATTFASWRGWHRRRRAGVAPAILRNDRPRRSRAHFPSASGDTDRDDVRSGIPLSRSLFGEVLLHRCGKAGGSLSSVQVPRGRHRPDDLLPGQRHARTFARRRNRSRLNRPSSAVNLRDCTAVQCDGSVCLYITDPAGALLAHQNKRVLMIRRPCCPVSGPAPGLPAAVEIPRISFRAVPERATKAEGISGVLLYAGTGLCPAHPGARRSPSYWQPGRRISRRRPRCALQHRHAS